WSRTKQTASYMNRALVHCQNGRHDQALWNVNMALTLDPAFVDALRLKAELTGQQIYMPHRSLLHDAVDHMIDTKAPANVSNVPADESATQEVSEQAEPASDDNGVEWNDTTADLSPQQNDAPSVSEVL